jgi:ATP-dependent RNA helicase DeaD
MEYYFIQQLTKNYAKMRFLRKEKTLQNFNELNLSPLVMRAISDLGYEKPSPIQAETLPILLGEPTDFLGLAATGTGKTAAFGIPLLERLDPSKKSVQALILCPTRELALQVAGQINLLGKYIGIRALPVYGGADYATQIRGLRDGVSIVVGTPGRVVDHMERKTLKLENLQTLVLDEADEMISMGFKDDLETILGSTPRESSNIWLFSATMSREVRKVADEYLVAPKQVQVNRTEMLSGTVEQLYYMTSESNKPEVLCKLVEAADDFYGLVFCQTKSLVADLTRYLTERRYRADCLHGDMDQNARERTMQSFRDRKVNLLVCTDVASRGLDVKDVTHVINYSLPRELDSYVHRIGRTARSGKTGFAMNLVTASHRGLIGRIEKATKSRMREGRIPTRKDIGTKKITQTLSKFQDQKSFVRAVELMDKPWKDAIAEMSRDEIAGRLLSMMFPEIFNAEREAQTEAAEPNSNSAYPKRNEYRAENKGRYGRDRSSGGGYGGRPDRGGRSDRRSDHRSDHRSEGPARFSGRSDSAPQGPSANREISAEKPTVRPREEFSPVKPRDSRVHEKTTEKKSDKKQWMHSAKKSKDGSKKDGKRTSDWNRPLTR